MKQDAAAEISRIKQKQSSHHESLSINRSLNHSEIEAQCDIIFKCPRMQFRPRKGHPLDEKISQIIHDLGITIPIVFIKANIYLIGSARVPCDLKNENVIVRVGGGVETFHSYVTNNHR